MFYIDWTRFNLQEISFIQLYFIKRVSSQRIMDRMKIKKTRFYEIKKRTEEAIERDYRKAKFNNPRLKPIDYEWESLTEIKIPATEYSLPYMQTRYIELIGKIPNRYKNNTEWLAQRIAWLSADMETKGN